MPQRPCLNRVDRGPFGVIDLPRAAVHPANRPVARLTALAVAGLLLAGCAGGNAYLSRVHTVTSLAVDRDSAGMTITAAGDAAGAGWGKVSIRRVYSPTFPPGVLAYELVAAGDRRIRSGRPLSWQQVGASVRVPPPPAGTKLVNIIGGVNDKTVYLPRVGRKTRVGLMHR